MEKTLQDVLDNAMTFTRYEKIIGGFLDLETNKKIEPGNTGLTLQEAEAVMQFTRESLAKRGKTLEVHHCSECTSFPNCSVLNVLFIYCFEEQNEVPLPMFPLLSIMARL